MGNPLDVQVGGNHYKKYEYQPIEFINDLNLSFIQGNIIKYIVRHNDKNGIQDIDKAIHYCELAINLESVAILRPTQLSNANKFIFQFEDDFIKQCISNVLVGDWGLVVKMCNNKINSIDAPIRLIDTINFGIIEVGVDSVAYIIHEYKKVINGISSTYNVFDENDELMWKITPEEILEIKYK